MDILKMVAQKTEVSEAEVTDEIKKAIDIAFSTKDPKARQLQAQLFPNGTPTPEEFILTLSAYINRLN